MRSAYFQKRTSQNPSLSTTQKVAIKSIFSPTAQPRNASRLVDSF